MSIGLFTFKNYHHFVWFNINNKYKLETGHDIVNKFTNNGTRLTYNDFTRHIDSVPIDLPSEDLPIDYEEKPPSY
jgi:hypothetical protein